MRTGNDEPRGRMPPVIVRHFCERCRHETPHKVTGIVPRPSKPEKTLRTLQCAECQHVTTIPGPSL
jgi:hypothetical protein